MFILLVFCIPEVHWQARVVRPKLVSEDAAYSFLLGVLTAGLLEGPSTVKAGVFMPGSGLETPEELPIISNLSLRDQYAQNAAQAPAQTVTPPNAIDQTQDTVTQNAAPGDAEVEQLTSDSNMERYKAVIDGVFTGGLPSGSDIVVGKTPSILQKYGAPDLNLHMSQC